MVPMPYDKAQDIPHLLHDARLLTAEYDGETRELRLVFECLRRNTDGSAMSDRTVTLHLAGVAGVTAAYDTVWPEERPSDFRLPEDMRLGGLDPWPLPALEVELSLDSATAEESLALAPYRESLARAHGDAGRLVCLHFSRGTPPLPTIVAVRCSGVHPSSGGKPLPLDAWADQFAAWWKAWEDHWDSQGEEGAEPVEEDKLIPVASGETLDKSYVPPRQPAFDCPRSDVPEELLVPVRTWFEAGLALDAAKRVSVAPNLDQSTEEQIASTEAWMTGDAFGSWDYAREVEAWWIEGDRAFVGVVGVTHYMPMDEEPAADFLTRWGFALRRRGGVWQINGYTCAKDDELASRPWARRVAG